MRTNGPLSVQGLNFETDPSSLDSGVRQAGKDLLKKSLKASSCCCCCYWHCKLLSVFS